MALAPIYEALKEFEVALEQDLAAPMKPVPKTSVVNQTSNQTFAASLLKRHVRSFLTQRLEQDEDADEAAEEMQACMDLLGWRDRDGDACDEYSPHCTPTGGYTAMWNTSWGTFANYSANGTDGMQACCACGGGTTLVDAMVRAADADVDGRVTLDELADVELSWQRALARAEKETTEDLKARQKILVRAKGLVHDTKEKVKQLRADDARREGPRRAISRFDRGGAPQESEPKKETAEEEARREAAADLLIAKAEGVVQDVGELANSTRRAFEALRRTRAQLHRANDAVARGDRVCRTAELADTNGDGRLSDQEFLEACYLQPLEA